MQGLKKVPSGQMGGVDSLARHVTFHSHLLNEYGLLKVFCQLNKKKLNFDLPRLMKIQGLIA